MCTMNSMSSFGVSEVPFRVEVGALCSGGSIINISAVFHLTTTYDISINYMLHNHLAVNLNN